MTDHTLPPNPRDWPSDPYRLLGVWPGVSARDLRKAYLSLIKQFKPEHAPAEFQMIRGAYEAITGTIESARSARLDVIGRADLAFGETAEIPEEVEPGRPDDTSPVDDDSWDLNGGDDLATRYARLKGQAEGSTPREETYLKLHWLLVIDPALDPSRSPVDWLIQGAIATGGRCGPSRELIRRAIDADPSIALGDRVKPLLEPSIAPGFLAEFASWRWRAARRVKNLNIIRSDMHWLGRRSSRDLESVWPRLLISAIDQLIWADTVLPMSVAEYARDLESFSNNYNNISDELLKLDFSIELSTAWRKLVQWSDVLSQTIHTLIPISYDEPTPPVETLLKPLLRLIERHPTEVFTIFDSMLDQMPVVFGHLANLFSQLDRERGSTDDRRTPDHFTRLIKDFFEKVTWREYGSYRQNLLGFCVTEAISPIAMATILADPYRFESEMGQPLAGAISNDWSLRFVYWACELADREWAPRP